MSESATKDFREPITPKRGDKVICAPEYGLSFEGWVRSSFYDSGGDWFVVVELRYTRRTFHVAPLGALLRVSEDKLVGETRIERYTEPTNV